MAKTKIVVTKKANMLPPIAVTKFSLENDLYCSTSETKTIIITLAEADAGTIRATITSDSGKDIVSKSCSIEDKVITCNMKRYLNSQGYYLSKLTTTTDKTYFDLSNVANALIEYHAESTAFGTQIEGQVITNDLVFNVILEELETISTPNIYIENNKDNKVFCYRTSEGLTKMFCEPESIYMPENKDYNTSQI